MPQILLWRLYRHPAARWTILQKNAIYADAGVREYWIVDPLKKRTTVYYYEEDAAPMIVPFDQPVTVEIYGDLQITISRLLQDFDL